MDEKLSIKVNVADRFYPLKIDRSEEEIIRKAAKLINDKVLQYQQRYADKDMQDHMAMVTLQYVIKMLENENKETHSSVIEELRELDQKLTDILSEE